MRQSLGVPCFVLLIHLIHLFCLSFERQKARLKAVESLREPRSIVVATDVAARGLDIPSVATVVHYDVARQVDTFIHRAGRTAVSTACIAERSMILLRR